MLQCAQGSLDYDQASTGLFVAYFAPNPNYDREGILMLRANYLPNLNAPERYTLSRRDNHFHRLSSQVVQLLQTKLSAGFFLPRNVAKIIEQLRLGSALPQFGEPRIVFRIRPPMRNYPIKKALHLRYCFFSENSEGR